MAPLATTTNGALRSRTRGGNERPRILCVDDDPAVLEGLADVLGRSFSVVSSSDPLEALGILKRQPDGFSVILSDMRMPGLRGTELLRMARLTAPDTVRILLTGDADVPAAVRAVNDAHLFRFLIKPCDSEELMRACVAAMGQHRLQTGERALLQESLRGCVAAFAEILALVHPDLSAEMARAGELSGQLGRAVGLRDWWEVEAAATLRYLGTVALAPELAEKMQDRRPLTDAEADVAARVPRVTRRLLGKIPRLEGVVQLLDAVDTLHEAEDECGTSAPVAPGVELLDLVLEYLELEFRVGSAEVALAILRGRRVHDGRWLEQLGQLVGVTTQSVVREVGVRELRAGMVLADDARMTGGGCLLARGQQVTAPLIERLESLASGAVREPLLVMDADSA
ncbi:MAG TPA: response regulator [Solirubrobacteraceae bacterium]|nr:response regulator [Solirubrobacteraceae bacterium]